MCSRVGEAYQAVLPPPFPMDNLPFNNIEYEDDELSKTAVLVWPGNQQLNGGTVNNFSSVTVEAEKFLQVCIFHCQYPISICSFDNI